MALVSPGVEVSIIDESAYRSSQTNSVPFILIATAQNKANAAGTGVASGTLASNANNTYLITSQRELVNTFGNPFFYNTTAGTPINGYELNEYGLLAAYSVLGVSNRAYVQRVDVDLAELAASLTRPTGNPNNNTWWLDTDLTSWGLFEWSSATNQHTLKTPIVITDSAQLQTGTTIPKENIGQIGSYAVVANVASTPIYYKTAGNSNAGVDNNSWVLVGSDDWKASWPTVVGTEANPTITPADTLTITADIAYNFAAGGATVTALAATINGEGITGVTADVVDGKLALYVEAGDGDDESSEDVSISISGTGTIMTDIGIATGTYNAPILRHSTHIDVPRWRSTDSSPRPTGSVWQKISPVNNGANIYLKRYDSVTGAWITQPVDTATSLASATYLLDPQGGGQNIAQNKAIAMFDVDNNGTAEMRLYKRRIVGDTVIVGDDTAPTFTLNDEFTISASSAGSSAMSTPKTVTLGGTTAEDFVAGILGANVSYVNAEVLTTGAIQITHTQGGIIEFVQTTGTPISDAGFVAGTTTGVETVVTAGVDTGIRLTNWVSITYTASDSAPGQDPADGTLWYYSTPTEVDIMIKDDGGWKGYQNVTSDVRGFDLSNTDDEGVIVTASEPTTQSDGSTALEYGDLWLDTSDLENFPMLYRWEPVDGVDQWVQIDKSDQASSDGILFADARWDIDGTTDPVTGDLIDPKDMLNINYTDIDAPDAALYPEGMLLFNTRRSGYNVKRFESNYFTAANFPDDTLPTEANAWVTASGLADDGSMNAGRHAQRAMIIGAMQAAIDTNTDIREEQRNFNLIAAPGYPELVPNMITLNNDRNNTAFIIGDTPLRLDDSGASLIEWATNNNGEGLSTGDGLLNNDPYLGVFYPSGQTNDLSGNTVVVPPSHMMLRTLIRNDEIGYPWLAPAGIRRGTIDNASALGYIDAQSGEFQQIATRVGIRDTLYENNVNPLTFIPGTGLVNYGNKTTQAGTALDRINVARLVAFIRQQVDSLARAFIFEPNDKLTRDEIKGVIEGFMNDLVAKRGIYDYLVVCDESNNTPSRIDRSELYVDIAIEPTKAVEYIYIPVRIKNTGEISGGA
jgi:hypothetical protein